MDIVDPQIEEYIERYSSPADPLLAELAEETRQTLDSPQMLSGPIAGRLLEMLGWCGRPMRQEQAQGILVAALGVLAGGRHDCPSELDRIRQNR